MHVYPMYFVHAKADKTCLDREKNEVDVLIKVSVGILVAVRDRQSSLGFFQFLRPNFLFCARFYTFSLIPFFSWRGLYFLQPRYP